MNITKKGIIIGLVVIIVLVFGLMIQGTSNEETNSGLDEFAQCLTKKGVVMFGTSWCSYCNKQKELFETSFKYVDFVDCDNDKSACVNNGVKGYPTWKINGENYSGLQQLNIIAQLSGCEI
ncbi:MAG: thioredoxin domain-containing protein [Candidatus ainarchaeum sp.]|nr:thioredoxin domain-containing protein [Candidatus ainarchaeum sp.]